MVYFKIERDFKGDPQKLWEVVSNIENIPKYWHGHREINIIKKDNNYVEAYVRFVFPSSAKVRYEINDEKKEVTSIYLEGPFKGTSKIKIDNEKIINEWDIKFNGIYKLISSWEVNHFKKGSEDALDRLIKSI